jgi:hypothetical protein
LLYCPLPDCCRMSFLHCSLAIALRVDKEIN